MEKLSTYVYSIVALVVIVLVIATTVVPIIEEAQKEQTTAYNNEDFAFRVLDTTTADLTIRWLSTTSYSINDVVYEHVTTGRILISDNILVAFAPNNLQVRDHAETGESGFNLDTLSSAGTDQTVTISNGVLTTNAGKTCDVIGDVLVRTNDAKATYGVFAYSVPCVVDYNSIVYSAATFTLNEKSYSLILSGKYNALSVKAAYCTTDNAVADESKFTVAFKSNSIGEDYGVSVGLKNYTAEVTYTDSGQTYTKTITLYLYAPIEYHMITTSDSAIIAMLGIIPVMMFIIPIMICISMIRNRGD